MRKRLTLAFLLLITFFIFLPKIASSSYGKPVVLYMLKPDGYKLEVEKIDLSWFGPQLFQNITLEQERYHATIDELNITAPLWSLKGPFTLTNGIISSDQTSLKGSFSLRGKVFSKNDFALEIDATNFPLELLSKQWAHLTPTLDISGTVHIKDSTGPLDLSFASDHFQMHLQGELTPKGITLREELLATFMLTPQLSSFLLKDINPLFVSAISSQSPVTLQISPEHFLLPLPFSLELLQIDKAILNLGKVQSHNGETLTALMSLLKASSLSKSKEIDVWFTPVSFQVQKGILTAGRIDMLLAHSVHLCSWGKVDLLTDQLDMFVGIPAKTLEKSFRLENLPKNYTLKVPIRGSISHPEIVDGPAVAKISTLMGAQKLPKKGVLGGVADLFALPKEEKDVPPPARPFPWD